MTHTIGEESTTRRKTSKTLRVQEFLAAIRRAKRRPPVHAGDVFRLLVTLTPRREAVYQPHSGDRDKQSPWPQEDESEQGVVDEAWDWVDRGDEEIERTVRLPVDCLPVLLADPDLNIWSVADRTGCRIVLRSAATGGRAAETDVVEDAAPQEGVVVVLSGDRYATSYAEHELQRIEGERLVESARSDEIVFEGARKDASEFESAVGDGTELESARREETAFESARRDKTALQTTRRQERVSESAKDHDHDTVRLSSETLTAVDPTPAAKASLLSYLGARPLSADALPADAPFPTSPLLNPRPFTTLVRAHDLPVPETWTRHSLASYVAALVSHRHPGPQYQSVLYPGVAASSRTDVATLLVRLFEDPRDEVRAALSTAALNAALRWFSRQQHTSGSVWSAVTKGSPSGGRQGRSGGGELSFRAEARRVFYHAVVAGKVRPDAATFNALLAGCAPHADWAGFASLLAKMRWMGVSADKDTWLLFLDAVGAEGRARDGKVGWASEVDAAQARHPTLVAAGGQTDTRVDMLDAERVQRQVIDAMEAHGMLKEEATRRAVAVAMAEGDADAAIKEYEVALDNWTRWNERMGQNAMLDGHASSAGANMTARASPPKLDLVAFVEKQGKRYGVEWLTADCGNRLLRAFGRRGYLDKMLELMRIMAGRQESTGLLVNVATLNTILGHIRGVVLGMQAKERQRAIVDDMDAYAPPLERKESARPDRKQAQNEDRNVVADRQPSLRPTLVRTPKPPTVDELVDMIVEALALAQARRVRPNPATYEILLDLFSPRRLPGYAGALGAVFREAAAAGQLTYLSRLRVGRYVWEAWTRSRWTASVESKNGSRGDHGLDQADENSRQCYEAMFLLGQRGRRAAENDDYHWWPEVEAELFKKLDAEAAAALAPLPGSSTVGHNNRDTSPGLNDAAPFVGERMKNLGQLVQPLTNTMAAANQEAPHAVAQQPSLESLIDFSGLHPPSRLPDNLARLPYRARGLLARIAERAAEAYRVYAAAASSSPQPQLRRNALQYRQRQQPVVPEQSGERPAAADPAAAIWLLRLRRPPQLANVVRDAVRDDRRRREARS